MHLPEGKYSVLFGTTLQVLVGDPAGKYGALSPLRLTVENSATFPVPNVTDALASAH